MLFLRRETFKEYIEWYPVNSMILLLMAVLFGLMEWKGGSTRVDILMDFGALDKTAGEATDWWRFGTSIFLHIGWQHLLFNGFALYVFASPLERMLGSFRYAVFFLLTGIGGNLMSQWLVDDRTISAGASGAIYGVYAAYLYLAWRMPQVLDQQSRQTVGMIVGTGVVYSIIVPHVNLYAHLGGFLTGFVLLALLTRRLPGRR